MKRRTLFVPPAPTGHAAVVPTAAWRGAWLPGALLLAALLAPATARPSPRAAGSGAERHRVGAGKVAIYNLAGAAVVEPTSGSETVVEVALAGRDAARLKVATGESEDRRNLRVLYPEDRVVYPAYGPGSSTTTGVRSDGTFGGRNSVWSVRRARISGRGGG